MTQIWLLFRYQPDGIPIRSDGNVVTGEVRVLWPIIEGAFDSRELAIRAWRESVPDRQCWIAPMDLNRHLPDREDWPGSEILWPDTPNPAREALVPGCKTSG